MNKLVKHPELLYFQFLLLHFFVTLTECLFRTFFFYTATEAVPIGVMVDVSALTDDELRKQLQDYGVNVGPVVCEYIFSSPEPKAHKVSL